jgi:hypothetical protein
VPEKTDAEKAGPEKSRAGNSVPEQKAGPEKVQTN